MRLLLLMTTMILLCLGIVSCGWLANSERVVEWYRETKEAIISHSEQVADRVLETRDSISGRREVRHYSGGQLLKLEIYEHGGMLTYIAQYPKDTTLCLVYELCEHGKVTYEGLEYRHRPIGLSTWYHCSNGAISMQGQRLKFRKYGIWRTYDSLGHILTENKYKGRVKISSLPHAED